MMNDRIEIQLVKLTDGGRLLQLSEKASGLGIETRLMPRQSVVRQKDRMFSVFEHDEGPAQTALNSPGS